MVFLVIIAVAIAALLISNKMIKADLRRRAEVLDWIRDVDKRWVGSADDRVSSFNRHNEMDQVVIDLQKPTGFEILRKHSTSLLNFKFIRFISRLVIFR